MNSLLEISAAPHRPLPLGECVRQSEPDATPDSFAAAALYDMHGNVWEWVQDCTSDSYDKDSNGGRSGNATADCPRIMRGGSWIDAPRVLRSAYRSSLPPQTRFIYRGFRVARSLD